ncbi:MAG: LPXTG cell wall anchor domain-containing protein [Oscillospiraceae bacterium]|nr:LPXTG cell wall anchor domain-containing protein [Oscillospiraceae bacterium]
MKIKKISLILLAMTFLVAMLVIPVSAAYSPYTPPSGGINGGALNVAPVTNDSAVEVGITPTGNSVNTAGAANITEASVPEEAAPATTVEAVTIPAAVEPTEAWDATATAPETTANEGGSAITTEGATPAPQETLETMAGSDNGTPLEGGPESGGNPDAANSGKTNPKTGDNSMGTILLMGLAVVAGAGIVVLTLKRSKKTV